jgi:hypothetical protein
MSIVITILILFALANCARSLRFAYVTSRDLNDGGYPIYGDAIHNVIALGLAAVLSGMTQNVYTPYQRVLVWAAVAMLFLNVSLIAVFVRAGNRTREKQKESA